MAVSKVDIESFGPDGLKYTNTALNLSGADITFEYTLHGKRYIYKGHETPDASGRYELTCPETRGKTTLYKLPGTNQMMGRWTEGGAGYGLWEIDLDSDDN